MEKQRLCFCSLGWSGFCDRLRLMIVAAVILGMVSWSGNCVAQVVPKPATPKNQNEPILEDTLFQRDQSVFVPAPRDLLRPLIRANRAIRENDIPQAVALLGEVLNESLSEDYLVPLSAPEGVSVSLRLKAQAILGSLSPQDRQLYRLRYGVQSNQMLEQAIEKNDFEMVSQVMQRFFYTDAGFDAAMLLGHHHLDEGRPIAAANCFQKIVESKTARAIHDPEVSVLLATCWILADSPDRATNVLLDLKRINATDSIQFLGTRVRLFDRTENANAWLLNLIGDSPLRNIELVNQWVMVGGNPQRNARSGTGFPLLNPKWVAPTMNDPDVEKSIMELQRELIIQDSAPIPSVQPLAIGNTVVMRAFDRMIGVDFETGKRVWVFPPWEFTNRIDDSNDRLRSRVINKTPLTERMWLDAVYGQASSDGETIFSVPKPGFSPQARTLLSSDAEPTLSRTVNELIAIDIKREGAFKWEVGGETGLDEPKLAQSFFLGAPLPLEDELFAVAQQGTEIRLVALEANTGKLKWHQQIATTESSAVKLLQDRYRRLAGVTPSYTNGVLVCSTGNGALVAVDVATHSLLWGYQYVAPSRKAVQPISPGTSSNSDPLDGLWRNSSIVIADGKVFYTPVDCQALICVDLHNGHPTWKSSNGLSAKTDRKDSMFMACVENGLAVLVGESSIRAISTQTGKQVWEQPLMELGKPSGRGYANQGHYYFPTTREKLLQINLTTGEITKTVDTDGVLGNLICYRGNVVSHGVDRLACFPQDAPNRRLVETAEAAGQLSPELLAIKAQLQMQEGKFREAFGSIQEAYEAQPNRAYESLMLDWIIRLIENDFEYGIEIAKRHEDRLLANRRFDFLAARINGMIHNNHPDNAVAELFELLTPILQNDFQDNDFLDLETSSHDRNLLKDDGPELAETRQERLTIRLDYWLCSRLKLLHAQGTRELRNQIETRVGDLAKQHKDLSAIDRHDLLRIFPMEWLPEQDRVELARALINSDQSLRVAQVLESLVDSKDSRIAEVASIMLAKGFLHSKMLPNAMDVLERLDSGFAGDDLDDAASFDEAVRNLRDQLNTAQQDTPPSASWNRGSIHVTADSDPANFVNPTVVSPIELVDYDAEIYSKYSFQFFGQTGEIEVLDGDGKSVFRFLARETPRPLYAVYSDSLVGRISFKNKLGLVDIATEIIAFDWLKLQRGENPVLWNLSIPGERDITIDSVSRLWKNVGTKAAPRKYENRVYVSAPGSDGICYLDRNQLVCIDTLSGKKRWQRSNLPSRSRLMGDSKHVIVWDSQNREALIFDIVDGRLLGTSVLAPEVGTIWKSLGCKILVSTDIQTTADTAESPFKTKSPKDLKSQSDETPTPEKMLGLYDLLDEAFVWKSNYPISSLGCPVGRDRIAILPPDKDLEFINIQTGKVEFRTPMLVESAERARIDGIGVSLRQGKYLVHFKRGNTPSRISIDSRNIRIRPLSYSQRLWVGSLICVDSVTGQNLWNRAVRFDNFQLGPDQPMNAPIYLLTRLVSKEDESGMSVNYVQFIGIDTDSGKLAVNHLHMNTLGLRPPFRISCDIATQDVTLQGSGNQITFRLVDDPQSPPRPVTYLTNQNSIPIVTRPDRKSTVDFDMIESEKQNSLRKAIAAEELLPQKRADEKRRLQVELSDPNDR